MSAPAASAGLRKWVAFGTGVAIEIRGDDLQVTAVRVRPTGARVRGAAVIGQFRQRPAAEWGKVYADFAKQAGVSHVGATVVLPRKDVIVRVLHMPGVAESDLAAAIAFQLEALHPFKEDEALHTWAALSAPGAVLVGIARRETVDQYAALFAEAGIRLASFTFSAAALYSSSRLFGPAGRRNFVAILNGGGEAEIYGESEARTLFSAAFDGPTERGLAMAAAELRLPQDAETLEAPALFDKPKWAPAEYDLSRSALVYSAALAGACPRLALPVNLLPADRRAVNSRWLFVPTLVLGVALLLVAVALMMLQPLQKRRYLELLQAQIAQLEPVAQKAAAAKRAADTVRARSRLLDEFRSRSKADLDALNELTKILPPPVWVNSLELTRTQVAIAGETERAEGLIKIVDGSPLFENTEFTTPISKLASGEAFRIRARREGAPK